MTCTDACSQLGRFLGEELLPHPVYVTILGFFAKLGTPILKPSLQNHQKAKVLYTLHIDIVVSHNFTSLNCP